MNDRYSTISDRKVDTSPEFEYGDARTPEIHDVMMRVFFPKASRVMSQQDVSARVGDYVAAVSQLGWEPVGTVKVRFTGTPEAPTISSDLKAFRRKAK